MTYFTGIFLNLLVMREHKVLGSIYLGDLILANQYPSLNSIVQRKEFIVA
jgi:hypothetical protein